MKAVSYGIIPYRITDDSVSIMMCQASKDSNWGFVKGKIDDGETAPECAVREAYEEIGVKLNVHDLEEMIYSINPQKDVGLFYISWLDEYDTEIKLNRDEIYSIEWFTLDNLPDNIIKNQKSLIPIIKDRFRYFSGGIQ